MLDPGFGGMTAAPTLCTSDQATGDAEKPGKPLTTPKSRRRG
jgi:hypothetical protein